MKKTIFSHKAFQEAYEKSKFSIWDKVTIVKNAWCISRYDKFVWMTATIKYVRKLTEMPYNPDSSTKKELIWFMLDIDKYKHFKSWKNRFPWMAFWECEIQKI